MSTAEQTWVDSIALDSVLREVAAERTEAKVRPVALRRILIALDLAAIAAGWLGAQLCTGGIVASNTGWALATFFLLVGASLAFVASQRLYLSRVASIRSVETLRLTRAAALAGVVALVAPRFLPVEASAPFAVVGAGATLSLLVVARGGYRAWLQSGRRQGRFLRSVVVVGANEEAYDLVKLVRDHPETGFAVAAVLGDANDGVTFPPNIPRLDLGDDVPEVIRTIGANGAVVAASALRPDVLNGVVRTLLREGLHVHLSSGLRGVDHRRLRSQPVAHEPLFYVEPLRLSRWQFALKRAIDVVLGSVVAVVVAVPLLLAAIAIKLQDRGPVLFRQRRVGRDGREFTVLKLRTMVPNAEDMYERLAPTLAGRDGPLIKLRNDPRRTPVGRLLERTSIDELPQLWNVLRGDMSLVGPRPAQASEVAAFDDELRARLLVPPGITGLWQVEARDNPSFSAYRRYDLFYIENWSVALDVAVLLSTAQVVLARGLRFLLRRDADTELVALG